MRSRQCEGVFEIGVGVRVNWQFYQILQAFLESVFGDTTASLRHQQAVSHFQIPYRRDEDFILRDARCQICGCRVNLLSNKPVENNRRIEN